MKRRKPKSEVGFDQVVQQIKPYRYYRTGLSNGFPALSINATGPVVSVRELRKQGDVITKAEIDKLFCLSKLPINVPEINGLVDDLNLIRVTVHARRALPDGFEDPIAQLDANLKSAMELIPSINAHFQASDAAFPNGVGRQKREQIIKSLFDLQTSIAETRRVLQVSESTNHSALWHEDAFYIGRWIEYLASAQNEIVSIKSPTGPGVDFIYHALKRAGVSMTGPKGRVLVDPRYAIARANERSAKKFDDECKALSQKLAFAQNR